MSTARRPWLPHGILASSRPRVASCYPADTHPDAPYAAVFVYRLGDVFGAGGRVSARPAPETPGYLLVYTPYRKHYGASWHKPELRRPVSSHRLIILALTNPCSTAAAISPRPAPAALALATITRSQPPLICGSSFLTASLSSLRALFRTTAPPSFLLTENPTRTDCSFVGSTYTTMRSPA